MPKRRSACAVLSSGGGAAGTPAGREPGTPEPAHGSAESLAQGPGTPEEMAGGPPRPEAESARVAPVFREGASSRLDTPLSREQEVPRWRELWDRFSSDPRSLTPEDLGELYEYCRRRMVIPARRLQNRAPDDAAEYLSRMEQLSAVERAADPAALEGLGDARRPELDALAEQAREVLRRTTGDAGAETVAPLTERQRRLYESLLERAPSLSEDERLIAAQLAWRDAEAARRRMNEAAVNETDPAGLAEAYASFAEAADRAAPFLGDRAAFVDAWRARLRGTVEYQLRRAGDLNDLSRPGGVPPSRGSVRLPEPRETGAERRIALLVPAGVASARLRENAAALGMAVVESPDDLPEGVAVVVNWGMADASAHAEALARRGIRLVNPDASRQSDKAVAISLLGDLAPRTTRDFRRASEAFGGVAVAKRSRGGTRGAGKEVLDLSAPGADDRACRYDLFQEFFPERDEWRVTVFRGRVLTAYSKNPARGEDPFNLAPQREFRRLSLLPRAAVEAAIEACHRVGAEFGGVDVIRDRRTGRFYVLEVNAAPGMSRETLLRLAEEAMV